MTDPVDNSVENRTGERNPPLTPSQVPDAPNPGRRPLTVGNTRDDDPQAIDDYFEAANHEPEEFHGLQIPKASIKPTNRLVNTVVNVTGQLRSVQLFTPDPNRVDLHMQAFRTDAVEGKQFLWSGEPFSVPNLHLNPTSMWASPSVLFGVGLAGSVVSLSGYTGAIYVLALFADETLVQGWAITNG